MATRAGPAVERIREQVRASPVINSDETGARVAGDNRCHWVFQTPTASYHLIAATKGAAVIAEFLGDQRPEVWGSDAAPAQLGAAAAQHQLCLAHQLRDLTYATEADDRPGSAWARQLRHVFGRALRLHRERQGWSAASFAHRRTRVLRAAERLIFGPPLGSGEAWQLQKRYRKHWATLFVFLEREDVEPTNNSSERDLRPAVMHRKMTGGYRSEAGRRLGRHLRHGADHGPEEPREPLRDALPHHRSVTAGELLTRGCEWLRSRSSSRNGSSSSCSVARSIAPARNRCHSSKTCCSIASAAVPIGAAAPPQSTICWKSRFRCAQQTWRQGTSSQA